MIKVDEEGAGVPLGVDALELVVDHLGDFFFKDRIHVVSPLLIFL